MSSMERHVPVLAAEVLSFVPKGGLMVDGTVGDGGHAELMLKQAPAATVIGIDRDPISLERASRQLKPFGRRYDGRCGSYADLLTILTEAEQRALTFVLLDLGYSSAQIDDPERGMSFMSDGVLDMRYDQSDMHQTTAAELVNRASPTELERILRSYGEEHQAKKIVRVICERRRERLIRTTRELAELISSVVHVKPGTIHPATRTFQALRIAVNHELDELEYFVTNVVPVLAAGVVVAIISFHSLEDRIVKRGFAALTKPGKNQFGEPGVPTAVALTKKPITASAEEVRLNSRSRSAKLRVLWRSDPRVNQSGSD